MDNPCFVGAAGDLSITDKLHTIVEVLGMVPKDNLYNVANLDFLPYFCHALPWVSLIRDRALCGHTDALEWCLCVQYWTNVQYYMIGLQSNRNL